MKLATCYSSSSANASIVYAAGAERALFTQVMIDNANTCGTYEEGQGVTGFTISVSSTIGGPWRKVAKATGIPHEMVTIILDHSHTHRVVEEGRTSETLPATTTEETTMSIFAKPFKDPGYRFLKLEVSGQDYLSFAEFAVARYGSQHKLQVHSSSSCKNGDCKKGYHTLLLFLVCAYCPLSVLGCMHHFVSWVHTSLQSGEH